MKLLVDTLTLLTRFGLFVGVTLGVLFVLYLLVGPARAALEQAEALEPERQALMERREALRDQAEWRALEAARLQDLLERQQTALDQLRRQDLPGNDTVAAAERGLAAAARTELTQAQAQLSGELQRAHPEFGAFRGTLEMLPDWVDAQRRAVARVCGLSVWSWTYWERPLRNYLASRNCEQAAQALAALERWQTQVQQTAARAEAARAQVSAVERRLKDLADERLAMEAQVRELMSAQTGLQAASEEQRTRQAQVQAERDELAAALTDLERDQGTLYRWWVAQRQLLVDWQAWLVDQWRQFWRTGLLIVLGVWLLPYAWRTLKFWVLAPWLSRARPIQLRPAAAPGAVVVHPSERVAAVEVAAGDALLARADHVRQVEVGVSRTRWFYAPTYPFLSYVAGLFLLTEVRAPAERSRPVRVSLAATGAYSADTYVVRVDLADHPGLVISPRHLIAVTERLELTSQWQWRNLHAWARGQLRYISLRGTGSLWIQGYGDVHGETLDGEESHQAGEAYLCFDTRLATRARRRETFWPYLLGRVPLLEVGMAGHGVFAWQKSTDATGANPISRAWNAFWSILGKFLGF